MAIKSCIILRGLPGSGKSTIAKLMANAGRGHVIVSADSFMVDENNNYLFRAERLALCHGKCFGQFENAIGRDRDVLIDNTNTSIREWGKYYKIAQNNGYHVTVLTVETDLTDEELAKRNVHGVPAETIRIMRGRMKSSS